MLGAAEARSASRSFEFIVPLSQSICATGTVTVSADRPVMPPVTGAPLAVPVNWFVVQVQPWTLEVPAMVIVPPRTKDSGSSEAAQPARDSTDSSAMAGMKRVMDPVVGGLALNAANFRRPGPAECRPRLPRAVGTTAEGT